MLRVPFPSGLALPLFVVVGMLAACASSGTSGVSRSSDLISAEEIAASSGSDAYQLVQQLRPRWLTGRGSGSVGDGQPSLPLVYRDSQRWGEIRSLERIQAGSIREIRFIRGSDATNRWGTGHGAGVVQVITRSGR